MPHEAPNPIAAILADLDAGDMPLSLKEATRDPLLQRNGQRMSLATIYRLAQRGSRGRPPLETIEGRGGKITTRNAIRRYLTRLNGQAAAPPTAAMVRAREKETDRILQRAGI